MGEAVKCDGCGAVGLRGLTTPCPSGWWYIESIDEGGLGTYCVFACSVTCRQGLWKKGPGPQIPGAAHGVEVLKGKALPCMHLGNEITQPCPCPPGCYCKQHTCQIAPCPKGCGHRVDQHGDMGGCGAKNGHDIYCSCTWRPPKPAAMFCDHANESPTVCRCPDYCYCKSHTCRG